MKILWIEDHEHALLLIDEISTSVAKKRLPLDVVSVPTLAKAEDQLRIEKFDLVLLDLELPDSSDGMTSACRIANLGDFKLAIVSASDQAEKIVRELEISRCNNVTTPIPKSELPFVEFIRYPHKFQDFAERLCAYN